MPSFWDLIAKRESAANAAAEQPREQIAKLSSELACAEEELAELAITRGRSAAARQRLQVGRDHDLLDTANLR